MSTIAPVFVEFRCNRCWYSNCADSEVVGTEVECRNCGHEITVPEATPDRISRAAVLLNNQPEHLVKPRLADKPREMEFDRNPSDRELKLIANRDSFVPLNQMDFSGYPAASTIARLIAFIVDTILSFTSLAAGFVLLFWLAKQGILENPMDSLRREVHLSVTSYAVLTSFFSLLILGQWILLATSGQTLGKKLMMIRIVNTQGRLPGFLQSVVLRNWLRRLFSLVPFFALIDLLFIFSESRRCLHDYFAGTRVVSNV